MLLIDEESMLLDGGDRDRRRAVLKSARANNMSANVT
jgi:hypothetical protein